MNYTWPCSIVWRCTPLNGWFVDKIPLKWMMSGGILIDGNPHMNHKWPRLIVMFNLVYGMRSTTLSVTTMNMIKHDKSK